MIETKKTEWDFSYLEGNFEDKRKKWSEVSDKFIKKWKTNKDYLKKPEVLKQALDEYEIWMKFYGGGSDELVFGSGCDELYYYWLKSEQNQSDPEIKAKFNKVEEFSKKIENDIRFFTLNISKIPKEEQKKFLEDSKLKDYKHFLEKLFEQSKYMLSEKEENIMSLKSNTSNSLWIKMTSEFLSKEERKVLDEEKKEKIKNFSDIISLLRSKNKNVRDSAARAFNDILKKHVETAEAEMNAILADKKVNDELRRYDRPDKSRHVADDIQSEIVDSLIKAVSDKFKIASEYYEFKAKLLGVKKLEYHERSVEYGSVDKKYSYEESVEIIDKVFGKLDKKFADLLKIFVEDGLVDVYPKKGKRQGAFCVHFLKSQPTYIMLNHTDKLNDVETFAHELGHAINNELMKEKQNALNFDTALSTAEVASTFMEDFVLEELMREADDELKLTLLMQKLDGDISTIFRQIACYMFEQELHQEFRKKGYLSKEEIGKLFQKHMKDYMGEFVEQSEGSENWWVYWGHIRRYFYVYSYSLGLLISKSLQSRVRKDKDYVEKVKEFLSAGVSKSAKNIFLDIGIDISKKEFCEEGIREVESLLKETKTLAKKLKKY